MMWPSRTSVHVVLHNRRNIMKKDEFDFTPDGHTPVRSQAYAYMTRRHAADAADWYIAQISPNVRYEYKSRL